MVVVMMMVMEVIVADSNHHRRSLYKLSSCWVDFISIYNDFIVRALFCVTLGWNKISCFYSNPGGHHLKLLLW